MRHPWLTLLLLIGLPFEARGETLYAIAADSGYPSSFALLQFDSASPGVMQRVVPITNGALWGTDASLELDPTDGTLYAFAFDQCQVLCPYELVRPFIVDPETGASTAVNWPDLPATEMWIASDKDIHPLTHELRFFGTWDQNYRYSLESLEFHVDDPLASPASAAAVAHTPGGQAGLGVETFALGYPAVPGDGLYLSRIGGPGGVPGASSGEVTTVGPAAATGSLRGFDIAASGAAYFSTVEYVNGSGYTSRLYSIDLQNGATQELGVIAVSEPSTQVTGIAGASPGSGSIVEIPALSRLGILLFVLALGGTALQISRHRRREALQ